MRFSTFVPLAVLAAAGSFAVARPVDEFMFNARDATALSERDVQLLSLVAREFLAARSDNLALTARAFDEEEEGLFAREDFHDELLAREVLTDDLFARDLLDGDLLARSYLEEELEARSMDQPRRENYRTYEDYERAFLEWNRRMRTMDHAFKKTMNKNEAQYQRHQPQASGSGSRTPSAWSNVKSAIGIGKSGKGGRK